MCKIIEIAISKKFKAKMESVDYIEAVEGKGIINDRYFKENNHKKSQITLIEIENIDYYNQTFKTSIDPINFRRNIVTQGIRLNELINKEFFIGNIKLKGHDLCRPCKSLQQNLGQNNIIKEFLKKGGLRCEVLKSGKVSVGDKIEF
tara:strand:- start:1129 stop:1569 length:441 start_codon:yes stop_codon:yes gene_type:complete